MRKDIGKLTTAAVAALLAGGTMTGCSSGEKKDSGGATAGAATEKHVCKGMNSCKGNGGCGATAGKNECKGKGNCATVGKHDCGGKNACKGQGGCKTGDQGCGGKNSCKGKGGCAIPLKK